MAHLGVSRSILRIPSLCRLAAIPSVRRTCSGSPPFARAGHCKSTLSPAADRNRQVFDERPTFRTWSLKSAISSQPRRTWEPNCAGVRSPPQPNMRRCRSSRPFLPKSMTMGTGDYRRRAVLDFSGWRPGFDWTQRRRSPVVTPNDVGNLTGVAKKRKGSTRRACSASSPSTSTCRRQG